MLHSQIYYSLFHAHYWNYLKLCSWISLWIFCFRWQGQDKIHWKPKSFWGLWIRNTKKKEKIIIIIMWESTLHTVEAWLKSRSKSPESTRETESVNRMRNNAFYKPIFKYPYLSPKASLRSLTIPSTRFLNTAAIP